MRRVARSLSVSFFLIFPFFSALRFLSLLRRCGRQPICAALFTPNPKSIFSPLLPLYLEAPPSLFLQRRWRIMQVLPLFTGGHGGPLSMPLARDPLSLPYRPQIPLFFKDGESISLPPFPPGVFFFIGKLSLYTLIAESPIPS